MRVKTNSGFALPTVLITSIIMMSVLLVGLSGITSVQEGLRVQFEDQINREASEAGILKAKTCLEDNGYEALAPWDDDHPLTMTTDCAGVPIAGLDCEGSDKEKCYVKSDGNYRTDFEVTYEGDRDNITALKSSGVVTKLGSRSGNVVSVSTGSSSGQSTTLTVTSAMKNGDTCSYNAYRFQPVTLRSDSDMQISEFQVLIDGVRQSGTPYAVGSTTYGGEEFSKAYDNSVDTKWYNGNGTSGYLYVVFPSAIEANGYRFATGNDIPGRDPISWDVYGSNDTTGGSPGTWTLLDTVSNFATTTARKTFIANQAIECVDTGDESGDGGGGGPVFNPAGTPTVESFVGGYNSSGNTNATGTSARFNQPYDADIDSDGNIFILDKNNNAIRKVTPAGVVSTYFSGGFNNPQGIAVDGDGNVYVADTDNHKIKKIDTSQNMTIFAGNSWGNNDGPVASANIERPIEVHVSGSNVYVTQNYQQHLRRISGGQVTTVGGVGKAENITTDNDGNIYLANWEDRVIRKVAAPPSLAVSVLAGSQGSPGNNDGTGNAARFDNPTGIAYDSFSNALYVTQSGNRIRKVTLGGDVTTFSGTTGGNVDGDLPSVGRFDSPYSIVSANDGSIYVVQRDRHNIRRIVLPTL